MPACQRRSPCPCRHLSSTPPTCRAAVQTPAFFRRDTRSNASPEAGGCAFRNNGCRLPIGSAASARRRRNRQALRQTSKQRTGRGGTAWLLSPNVGKGRRRRIILPNQRLFVVPPSGGEPVFLNPSTRLTLTQSRRDANLASDQEMLQLKGESWTSRRLTSKKISPTTVR